MITETDIIDFEEPSEKKTDPVEWLMPCSDHIDQIYRMRSDVSSRIEILPDEAYLSLSEEERQDVLLMRDSNFIRNLADGTEYGEGAAKRFAAEAWLKEKSGYWPVINPVAINIETGHDIINDTVQEEYIIGQTGQGIRFLNFEDDLSPEAVNQCQRYVEVLSQYVGSRLYDVVTDVVISKFPQRSIATLSNALVIPGVPGVIFINEETMNKGIDSHQPNTLLATLIHETGHLIHGSDDEAETDLQLFADAIGWGTNEEELPTGYSHMSVQEAFAETAMAAMSNDESIDKLPRANDAFLTLLQKRILQPGESADDRPIATPVERVPIVVDRRVGEQILYPGMRIPDKILVAKAPPA